ncbi:uncharacterized protein TNCV_3308331 [Trichonephila clavipes]|nr:uncharacterized protein TNCV_3308331 [Trichonephila clavipes]
MTGETVDLRSYCVAAAAVLEINVRLWIAQCDHAFTFSALRTVTNITLSRSGSSPNLATRRLKIKKLLTDLQLGDEKLQPPVAKMKELSNGQLQDDFLQSLWLQRMPPHTRLFCLHPQSLWINWLSSLIRFLRLMVHPQLSVLPQLFLHHPFHLHAVFSQPWTLCQADPRAVFFAELTRERNSSRQERYSSDRRNHIHALGMSIEEVASATIIAVIKSRPASVFHLVHLCKKTSKLCHSWNGRALETYQPVIFIRPQVWPEIPHRL